MRFSFCSSSLLDNINNQCSHLQSINRTNFGVSVFILLGIICSYLPQHHRIIRRRSPEGISPYFLLLGSTATTCSLANILLLPRSVTDIRCCRHVSGLECFAGILGIGQIGAQWLCFTVTLLLFFVYFPRVTVSPSGTPAPGHPSPPRHTFRSAQAVTLIYLLHLLLTILLAILLARLHPAAIAPLATILGVLAALLTAMQYLPQIYTTFCFKAVGSLSIPMMLIQTPGSFIWAASLATRLGWAGWSAWGVMVVSGFLQGALLIMSLSYEIAARSDGARHKINKTDDDHDGGGGGIVDGNEPIVGEQRPLLADQR